MKFLACVLALAVAWSSHSYAANQVTAYYDDAVAYCAAAGDVDRPGPHYTGPRLPKAIMEEAASFSSSGVVWFEDIRWRCLGGLVVWCLGAPGAPCTKDSAMSVWMALSTSASGASSPRSDDASGVTASSQTNDLPTNDANEIDVFLTGSEMICGGNNSYDRDFWYMARITPDSETFFSLPSNDALFPIWLSAAKEVLLDHCRQVAPGATPSQIAVFVDGRRAKFSATNIPGSEEWEVLRNDFREEYKRAATAEQKRQEAQQAQDARDEAQRAKRQQFIDAYGVTELVAGGTFASNPFLFEGKTIGTPLSFERMIAKDQALFFSGGSFEGKSFVLLDQVPITQFTAPGQLYVIALTSKGSKELTALGSSQVVPYGSFVGAYRCTMRPCVDFFN